MPWVSTFGSTIPFRPMLTTYYQKLRNNILAIRQVLHIGGTLRSGMLYPFRRKFSQDTRCQIDFKSTVSMTSPPDAPLLDLIEEIWVRDSYTRNNLKLCPGAVVIDIGANIGAFTVWIARANPKARIIAVEPDPRNLTFLSRNLFRNAVTNVSVVPAACGGEKGEGVIYARGSGALHSLFSNDMQGSTFYPLYKAAIVTLEEIFDQYSVERCDLLKIDCEGSEYDILFSSSVKTLSRISKISLEYHVGFNEHSPAALESFLRIHGFEVECLPMRHDGTGLLYASQPTTHLS
jgi:FkbM family methyltransferase